MGSKRRRNVESRLEARDWLKPESGFLPYRWDRGYNEALLLYVLAMGSPSYPIGEKGYRLWTSTFEIKELYSVPYIYAGPLFIHQMSQLWLGMKGIQDDFTRSAGFDYFENSRRATYAQRNYALQNPKGFFHYGEHCWAMSQG